MKKIVFLFIMGMGVMFASDVKKVDNALYQKECASCHFGFQPGLLPARSWVKIMGNLDNHFKTDASLDALDNQKILAYLVKNASDNALEYKRSRKINNSIRKDEIPIRITETAYFIHKHREIPSYMIAQKEVNSLSNCAACHTRANEGSYSEREIRIPNYRGWEND